MSVRKLEQLAQNAKTIEQGHKTKLGKLLQRLEKLDPEVAQQALETFGNRTKAAHWLGKALRQFGDQSAYEMLAHGKRLEVLEALVRIDSGFFT